MKFPLLRIVLAGCLFVTFQGLARGGQNPVVATFSDPAQWTAELPAGITRQQDGPNATLEAVAEDGNQPPADHDRERGIFNPSTYGTAGKQSATAREVVLKYNACPLLPVGTVRAGLWVFVERPMDLSNLWLSFVDAQGHSWEYTLRAPSNFQGGWQYLDTFPFDVSERGKLHPQVGRLLGSGSVDLPVMPFKFSGVHLEIPKGSAGKWRLGQVEADGYTLNQHDYHWGLNIPGLHGWMLQSLLRTGEAPYMLAGQVLPDGGSADVSWEVRAGFQGRVISQASKQLAVMRMDATAMGERLPLGELAAGEYEVIVSLRKPGAVTNQSSADAAFQQKRFSLAVLDSPITGAPGLKQSLSVDPGQAIAIPTPVWAGAAGEKKWRITDRQKQVVAQGAVDGKPVEWSPPSPGIYGFVAERIVDGRVQDREVLRLGGRTSPDELGAADFSARATAPTEADLFGPGHNFFTWATYENHPEQSDYFQQCHQWIADGRKAGFDLFRLRVDWEKIELLPGVYDFAATDKLVDDVARQGGKVILELHLETPDWLTVSHQLDSYGRPDVWQHGRMDVIPSLWTQGMLPAIKQFVEACVRRYRNHPALAGYHTWGFPGTWDWTTVDRPWWGQRMDYSPAATGTFLESMQGRYSVPPVPTADWRKPDLSQGWRDWVAFRQNGLDSAFIDNVVKPLRSLDDRRLITAYFGLDYASPRLVESARTLHWRRHTGGSEPYYETPMKANLALADTGSTWPQEASNMTPLPAGLELATFNIGSTGGDGFHWNYYWRNNMPVGQWTPERDAGLQEWETLWAPLWKEMRDAKLAEPMDLAATMTWSTMQYGSRSFFGGRMFDYVDTAAAAMYRDGLWPDFFSENSTFQGLSKYKLIVVPPAASQVMPSRMADALAQYVSDGGKLVLFPDSGKWIVEEGGEPGGLLRRLDGGMQVEGFAESPGTSDLSGNSGLPATALVPLRKAVPAGDSVMFPSGQGLNLRPGLALKEQGISVEARFDDNSPAVVHWKHGRGEVALFAGVPDWEKSPGFAASLYAWAGGTRQVSTDRPDVEVNHLVKGSTHYVIVHRLPDYYRPQTPALDRARLREKPPVEVTWRLRGMPEGTWRMTEISVDGSSVGTQTASGLAAGVKTSLFLVQTKVYKLEVQDREATPARTGKP